MTSITPTYQQLYPEYGYWLSENEIRQIESEKNAKFIGHWFLRNWQGVYDPRYKEPMDFFYVLDEKNNPSGKSKYFGVYKEDGLFYFIDAMNTFNVTWKGIQKGNNIYIPLYKQELPYLTYDKIVDIRIICGDFIVQGTKDSELD